MPQTFIRAERQNGITVLRLCSQDGTNRLTRTTIIALIQALRALRQKTRGVILAGNLRFFSAGADLQEIAELTGPDAYEFAKLGQCLMAHVENFPSPVYTAISGHCMGGGLDLALASHRRIASPNAIFAHRGAALGLITGWGGTQRLPRLIGKARALEMFITAEKLTAVQALAIGLIDATSENPVAEAIDRISQRSA